MKRVLKKNSILALLLVLVTWLMTGLAVDDKFSDDTGYHLKRSHEK